MPAKPTKKKWKFDGWEKCSRCEKIPSAYGKNFMNMLGEVGEDPHPVPSEIFEFKGMDSSMLNSGYKDWVVECELCGTRYLAEVDVEPFVHDFTFSREDKDGVAHTQFGERVELR